MYFNHSTSKPSPSLPSQNDELQHHPLEPFDSPSAMLAIVQLENHAHEISHKLKAASGMKTDNIENILQIEEECVQLSAQVCHLQQQMDKEKAEMKSHESELLKEIEVLWSQETHVFQSLVPVDASIAEESMEFAMPLQPSSYPCSVMIPHQSQLIHPSSHYPSLLCEHLP
ncbi:hypothetical protein EDC04DRAFT_3143158 [Pisolithus marmoratus]|nr:hypothetical protein EDC04DRAFT_3143158 [Pisolithus marmoratus]